ncbi:unnamed protein product [Spirodela intermedia]|uniref:Protein kinase domain-containing protein n=1 Tax=Spirodela intermedia TaxID=51605 RepID=A0A7I8L7B2_SPIIN|nr:unnamed protein product [Spirodela intermedia]
MGYLSCKAQASVITCRSISSVVEHPAATAGASSAAGTPRNDFAGTRGGGKGKARAAAGDGGEEEVAAEDRRKNQALQVPRRVRVFSYTELEAATSHFSEQNLLGRGSHGSVYRAILRPSGRFVAVKRPSRLQHFHHRPSGGGGGGGGGGSGRFLIIERNEVENEIDILSRIHNPRLVNLVGVSTYDDSTAGDDEAPSCSPSPAAIITSSSSSTSSFRRERLLVVEYMPNGTLYELLHSNPHPPGWARRLRLALQTAKAIHALHSCTPPVIHRDVKSANVLIDSSFNARLGDFGLALRAADDSDNGGLPSSSLSTYSASLRSTPPAGTLGYLDPGYITPENLSTKTDVFSFGILLIEIMSGRKAIDVAHSPPSVVEWAVPLLRKGKVLSLYDPRIPPPKDPAARRQLACLAASCVRSVKEKRPSMEEVIVCLKLLYKTLPSKMWTSGLSVRNPCLMVEAVESTHNKKPSRTDIEEVTTLSPVASCASPARESEDKEGKEMLTKKSPSSSKAVHPLINSRKDFSQSRGGRTSGRNLMDLMMAPDVETLKFIGSCHQGSIIRRQRTLHRSQNNNERDHILDLWRNHSMKGSIDVLSNVDAVKDLDGKVSKLEVELL